MQGFKRVLHIIINVLLWILIVIIAFFAVVSFSRRGPGKTISVFGYTPMTVLSDSMAPTFHADDLIIVKAGDTNSYQEGDIISFWTIIDGKRSINTHRVVGVYREGNMVQYATRGDANSENDSYVVASTDIVGRFVASVPFLGKVLAFLSTSVGFFVVIILPILAFFLYQLYRLIVLLIEIKRQTVKEATRAAMEELEQERASREEEKEPALVGAANQSNGESDGEKSPDDSQ